jgi:hypothetical protein
MATAIKTKQSLEARFAQIFQKKLHNLVKYFLIYLHCFQIQNFNLPVLFCIFKVLKVRVFEVIYNNLVY